MELPKLWLAIIFFWQKSKTGPLSTIFIIFFFSNFSMPLFFFSPLHSWQLNCPIFFFFSPPQFRQLHCLNSFFYLSPLPYNFGNSLPQFLFFSLFFLGYILSRNFGNYIIECQLSFSRSITSFLSPLSYFFLKFWQYYCQNLLL